MRKYNTKYSHDHNEDNEEDLYMAGMGSPGMSSLGSGSLGANTNRGLGPLPEDHHEQSLMRVKKFLRNKKSNSGDSFSDDNQGSLWGMEGKNWFGRTAPYDPKKKSLFHNPHGRFAAKWEKAKKQNK
jgi:hypothetical protein